MLSKKSIVLNGVSDREKRAVLTLENDEEFTTGNVRLYNFGILPRGIISLGICHDGQVTKAGLTHTGGMVFTFNCSLKKIPQNFSCAIVNFLDGEPTPILYGNSEGYGDADALFDNVISSLSKATNTADVEKVLDEGGVEYAEELEREVEEEIDRCMTCQDCENCKYKQFYMQSVSTMSEKEETSPVKMEFYDEMKGQIEDLFANNPSEEYLQELIPNSKWVKVSLGSNDYYVLGLIYEEEKLKYICYGVPGVYQKNAPRELSGYPVWFPLDGERPQGFGYWLSYQDADSGESVKAVVE